MLAFVADPRRKSIAAVAGLGDRRAERYGADLAALLAGAAPTP